MMNANLLICTDLDRTLIPNGPQPESPAARPLFSALTRREEVSLAYVSGRHRGLVLEAIVEYGLPMPDFVIGDVGTSLYRVESDSDWTPRADWEAHIGTDWAGASVEDLKGLLSGVPHLRLQEPSKQGRFKLSFYAPEDADSAELVAEAQGRLADQRIRASLIWSVDETVGVGLLDVLPERATKYHAVEFLVGQEGYAIESTVFSGDSGNDLEPLTSPLPAVLVANAHPAVREEAVRVSSERGLAERLYCAKGGFLGMNGNYAAGILEGVAHYHPVVQGWLTEVQRNL
jgi:HAD superfamily hydrolase (TIGR01484 family)